MKEWLTEESQYQDDLNLEQIGRIKDPVLREIRIRHWKHRHKIFLDEQNIPDEEFERMVEKDWEEEKREISEYRENSK